MLLWVFSYHIPDAYRYTEVEPYLTCDMVIDSASSVLWCERYVEPGEFIAKIRATPELLIYFWTHKTLIARQDTDRVMVTDRILMTTSAEDGDYITISGKSAEGLAGRRIISQKGSISGMNAAAALRYYMQENIASWWYYHEDTDHQHGRNNPYSRRYINLLQHGQDDERITRDISAEPFGKNLGSFITDICRGSDFGFKVAFDGQVMTYSFYMGDDRSLNQNELPAVVFSEDFQNLGDTEYERSSETYASHAIAGGSGTGQERVTRDHFQLFRSPDGSGMNLREIFVDASGTSDEMVGVAAQEACFAAQETVNFTGEILPTGQFEYRRDYFLGDLVSVVNRYGISGTATVTEVIETEDESGYKVIPTLGTFDVQEYITPEKPDKPVEVPEIMVGSGSLVRTFYDYGQMNGFVGDNRDKFFYALIRRGKTIPDGAFSGLSNVTTVVFQTKVREIGSYAFSGCGLNSVDLSTIKKMHAYAFNGCDSLRSLTIPGNITDVPEGCFYSCLNLMSVQIAAGVETIGENAFAGCHALTTITINKQTGSIPGAPWGAPNATVVWTG